MNLKLQCLSVGALFFLGTAIHAQKTKRDSSSVKDIDEVVVVAYGKQKKITLTGSNVQVGAKEIEGRPISNVIQALDGSGAGVQVSAGSGQPGSGLSIRIRGTGSYLVSNDPLIVLDGVPYNGSISTINPDDVESMNVLKDASSTSLYGSSAANGVVLITTKRGKKNRQTISLNASTGMVSRFIKEYDRVGPADYYLLTWESMRNGRRVTNPNESLAASNLYASNNLISGNLKTNVYDVLDNQLVVDGVFNPNAKLKYDDFDWQKEILGTAIRQDYSLAVAGGSDKTTYYTSFGYTKEDGYVIKSDFERLSLRLNLDSQLRNWFKVGTSLTGAAIYSTNSVDGAENNSAYINPYRWTRTMGPIYSPYLHDPNTGQRMYGIDGQPLFDPGNYRGSDAAGGRNVIQELLLNDDITRRYELNANVYAELQLLPDLTFRTNGAYSVRSSLNRGYTNRVIGDAIGIGAASRTNYFYQDITFNQILTYQKAFQGGHDLTVLAGHENSKYDYYYLYGSKRNQILDNFYEFSNFIDLASLSSTYNVRAKEGWFGRVNYNFLEKYMLEASVRRDGSSRFEENVRWQSFWSVGAGWVINKENFLKNVKAINLLKLRASYGEIGNDGLSSWYAYKSLFGLGYNNGTEPGILLSTVADPTITWETKVQRDLGLDFALFNNRVKGSVEYFNSKTKDLLFPLPTPVNAGIPGESIDGNVGELVNKGFEFNLGVDIVKNQNVTWGVNVFATTYKNELTKLPPDQTEIINGTKKLMVGKDLYSFWLRSWYGVDPADGAGLFLLDQDLFPDLNASDVRNLNGVLVTTNQNKALYEYHGKSTPDIFGSFSTNLRFKNWELLASFNYQVGGKIYDTNYATLMGSHPQGAALHADMLNRWTTPGQVTDVPIMSTANSASVGAASSRWLVDASYLMLRNASIGYNFNPEMIKGLGISNLKLYVSGENLWLASKRQGLEPYQSFNGTTTNRYSPSRIITFGLSTKF
ncbi:SusC/RagA family TonB-linked outer membrane protein [Elizabethkingia sp. JS20170427COW]|uniref:SusC/RagA family TonB-linked outer membrane protein n=1 Tax=Elizabethkingia sp. JS20170427COW TaxID=2583851 RepID=UPI001110701B|nr:SusC/RagA family TonB-linked outer membrane protein [Elizabethkingia sp. JS20170427COW]QCX53443.1 SusC/RagA family TonB-linked outer membrane protein [Elizabethkingia sp. JS20170427COW]